MFKKNDDLLNYFKIDDYFNALASALYLKQEVTKKILREDGGLQVKDREGLSQKLDNYKNTANEVLQLQANYKISKEK